MKDKQRNNRKIKRNKEKETLLEKESKKERLEGRDKAMWNVGNTWKSERMKLIRKSKRKKTRGKGKKGKINNITCFKEWRKEKEKKMNE